VSISSAPRGPYAKTAARIEQILDIGVELFAANGYRATTMKEVALRAGLTQPGLQHHFPTKDDLLIGVLRRRDERSMEYALSVGQPWTVQRLIAVVADNERNAGLVALDRVVSAEATSPKHPAHEFYRHRYEWIRSKLTDAFTSLREHGRLRAGSPAPAHLAIMMLALIDGLQTQWLIDPEAVGMETETRNFLRAYVEDVPGDEVGPLPGETQSASASPAE
jgi:AcrR family transcriptional regulator